MKKPNLAVILNFRSRLIKNYLAKVFYIIEKGPKKLSFLPNDARLIINLIDKMDTDFGMVKNKAISAGANTTKKLYIQKERYAFDLQIIIL